MRDAERRREIKDYYLGISADEITSYLTPASFDLWESLARYRRELQIGARWLEIGGGMGDLAAAALVDPGSLLVIYLMLSEMFPGHPASIWADILHVLPSFADLARLTGASRLQVLESHSLYHRYPPTAAFNAEFHERMLRLVLRMP